MKKRCEICGKIYEPSVTSDESGYITIGVPGEIDGEKHRVHASYATCVDCAQKIKGFVESMLEDNTEEPIETYGPKKNGHWSLLYSPITDSTVMKCSCCEFTLELNGRVLGAHKMPECPNCKAVMGDRVDDYSL